MSKMLSSWKEIAQFFGKGVRTVQRWEKTLALPIHRPPGAPSNVVLARTSDLEAWMHHGPVERAIANAPDETTAGKNPELVQVIASLEQEVQELRLRLVPAVAEDEGAAAGSADGSAVERVERAVSNLREIRSSQEDAPASPELFVKNLPWPAMLLDSRQRSLQTNVAFTHLLGSDGSRGEKGLQTFLDDEMVKAATAALRKSTPSTLWQKQLQADEGRRVYDVHIMPLTLQSGERGLLLLLAPREAPAEASLAA